MTIERESLSSLALRLLPLAEAYASGHNSELLEELGSGGSASVYLLKRNGELTALKVYDPSFLDEKNGPSEKRRIELQKKLIEHNCPTLVKIVHISLEAKTCFIEMEYVAWKNLKEVIHKTPAEKVESLFCQLTLAVRYLESQGLVHRDIKPENIMVDESFECLKLIDFGVMRQIGNEEDIIDGTDHGLRRPFIASAQYSSPEYLFRLKEPSNEMWLALTIYQLGGVLHDLIMRQPLFSEVVLSENKFALAMAVLTEVPIFNDVEDSLKHWAMVASNCLVKDPELRLALVNLKDITTLSEHGAERLKHLIERRRVLKTAKDIKDHQEAKIKHSRISTLLSLQNSIRQKLISTIDKAYGIVVDLVEDNCIRFEFEIEKSVKLQIHCHFEWLTAFTPLVSNATLTAFLGNIPDETKLTHKAVGQIVATPTLDEYFVISMLDSICDIIASTVMHLALGEESDTEIQFVDANLLVGII